MVGDDNTRLKGSMLLIIKIKCNDKKLKIHLIKSKFFVYFQVFIIIKLFTKIKCNYLCKFSNFVSNYLNNMI